MNVSTVSFLKTVPPATLVQYRWKDMIKRVYTEVTVFMTPSVYVYRATQYRQDFQLMSHYFIDLSHDHCIK